MGAEKEEHGHHPPVDLLFLTEVQLGEDGVDVFFHGARRKCQRVSNGGIRLALRHARQKVSFTRSELSDWRVGDTSTLRDQALHHARVDDGATLRHFANCGYELIGSGNALFQQVSATA